MTRELARGLPDARRGNARQGNPCVTTGYRFISVNLAVEAAGVSNIHDGEFFGYQVVSGGSASAFIQTGRIRQSTAGPDERTAVTGEGLTGLLDSEGRAPFSSLSIRVPTGLTGTMVIVVILYPNAWMPMQRALIAGGATGLTADVRNADASDDFAKALLGLVVNARTAVYRSSATEWALPGGDLLSTLNGQAPSGYATPLVAASLFGNDSTGALTMRALESRAISGYDGAATSLFGALVGSYQLIDDTLNGGMRRVAGLSETTGSPVAPAGLQMRASGYWSSRRARRFYFTSVRNTPVTGINVYAATSPSVIIVAAATNEIIISSIMLSIRVSGTVPQEWMIVVDPDNRYSSGGTSRTPANCNLGSVATYTPTQFLDGAIVATAEDADERDVWQSVISGTQVLNFNDELIIAPGGSLLIYVVATVSSPTFTYAITGEVVNVQ